MNSPEPPGLYIHVPFCGSKCPYCDFYSVTEPSLIPLWLEALEREARLYREHFPAFDALYIGGGTPSLLDARQTTGLMETLFRHFRFSPDTEITLEANPEDVTSEWAALLLDLGCNRISLGVQSFNDRTLRFLQRRHTAGRAERAVECLKRQGFCNIGIDLMYGFPVQTESDWLKSLNRALDLEPTHLSCYQLTIAEKTPFGVMHKEGLLEPINPAQEEAFFQLTSEFLVDRGFVHYEVSNYARGEAFFCRQNRKYWRRIPYLGLGPSAHSFCEGERWWNVKSITHYDERLRRGRSPVEERERLSAEQEILETLALGFRTMEGVAADLARKAPHADRIIRDLMNAGLVIADGDRIVPTTKGFLVADSLPLLFC